ncbi:hypothetical protein F2P79_009449 [Pimephales promelas]|nr:hypothetical protein F2P79_009449 [Pimephales promelas]
MFSSYCHGSIFQGNASCNYLSSSLYQMTMHPFIKMLTEMYCTEGNMNLVDFMHSEYSSYWSARLPQSMRSESQNPVLRVIYETFPSAFGLPQRGTVTVRQVDGTDPSTQVSLKPLLDIRYTLDIRHCSLSAEH